MKILMKFAVVCVFLLPSIAEASLSDEDMQDAKIILQVANIDPLIKRLVSETTSYNILEIPAPPATHRLLAPVKGTDEVMREIKIPEGMGFLCEFIVKTYTGSKGMTDEGLKNFSKLSPRKRTKEFTIDESCSRNPLYQFLMHYSEESTNLRSITMQIDGPNGYGVKARFIPYGQTLIGPNQETTVTLNKKTAHKLMSALNQSRDTYFRRFSDNIEIFHHTRTIEQKERDYQALLDAQNGTASDSE